jgi:hypothetical protein
MRDEESVMQMDLPLNPGDEFCAAIGDYAATLRVMDRPAIKADEKFWWERAAKWQQPMRYLAIKCATACAAEWQSRGAA